MLSLCTPALLFMTSLFPAPPWWLNLCRMSGFFLKFSKDSEWSTGLGGPHLSPVNFLVSLSSLAVLFGLHPGQQSLLTLHNQGGDLVWR